MASYSKHQIINGVELAVLQDTVDSIETDERNGDCLFKVENKWTTAGHSQSRIKTFYAACQHINHKQEFVLDGDEPVLLAGQDKGPSSVEHLLNALAGCITSSIIYHASLKGIEVKSLESVVEGELDLRGFMGLDEHARKGFNRINVKVRIDSDENDFELIKEYYKFSPVFDVISRGTDVKIELERI